METEEDTRMKNLKVQRPEKGKIENRKSNILKPIGSKIGWKNQRSN